MVEFASGTGLKLRTQRRTHVLEAELLKDPLRCAADANRMRSVISRLPKVPARHRQSRCSRIGICNGDGHAARPGKCSCTLLPQGLPLSSASWPQTNTTPWPWLSPQPLFQQVSRSHRSSQGHSGAGARPPKRALQAGRRLEERTRGVLSKSGGERTPHGDS